MKRSDPVMPGRRHFVVKMLAAGAGLTLGMYLPVTRGEHPPPEAGPGTAGAEVLTPADFEPNAFVRITPDNRVTVVAKHLEMGQGSYTGLATLVAEELDAAWAQVDVEGAPADANRYNNLSWGKLQGTGGSSSIANSYEQMRRGRRGRAADDRRSGRRASFGELAELAAKQPVPDAVFLKEPCEFRLIGTRVPRKDSRSKVNGTAVYTQDIKLPGLLTALVAHPPRFGARVKTFDAGMAKRIAGVVEVVAIPNGVAVLGKDVWSAKQGRDALQIEWDESAAFKASSSEILAQYRELARQPGTLARSKGDAAQALQSAARVVKASVVFPYLAHAALEPMNCAMRWSKDGVEIWNGEQFQTQDQQAVAEVFAIDPAQVKINMLYAGGSFGRRANPASDYLLETAHIVKAINGRAPVKLIWTREDDMRAGYYRPMFYHELEAGLDADGKPVAWHHRLVGQSIATGSPFEGALIKDGVDVTSVEGASTLPYAIPSLRVDLHSPKLSVPVQWWRSVGSTHTAFAVETFIDQLAAAAGRDPVEFRRSLLADHPRHLGVLQLAAEKAGWGTSLAAGRGRGIAVHQSFKTFVAQVAEVMVHADRRFTVDRVVIAVDCGVAVNPDVIRAQMEGGMGFGLSAALGSEITLEQGRVVQSNFHDYVVLRIDQMPRVEVHIVNSAEPPTGVGEPATPVIAPAVANALYHATGQRFDRLPLKLSV